MKYIITESQYQLLLEKNIPIWFRRRISIESLHPFIRNGVIEYPNMCEIFETPEDYAEGVIEWAADEFVNFYDDKFINDDRYPDTIDYLRSFCRTYFEDSLTDGYILNCNEE